MARDEVVFDFRAKCRLSPEWAADKIAKLRKERDALKVRVSQLEEDVRYLRRKADDALSNPIFED